MKDINNVSLLTCPGLNSQQLLKHIPPSIATALVNLNQELKKLHSKKKFKSELNIEEDKTITYT